jgi:ABC-type multidrug transport system fused ATPase/permease subunit
MFDFDNFDREKIKRVVLITILSMSLFFLLLLIFPTIAYIILILGVAIPTYFLYKNKKEEDE